ncbi:MAG: LytTR family DNA-binding domain-containing protein [Bacteroidales bacterium]|nr:LytTR family DNA-binding domain-containing protein [Bacteroidales bacterium]
MYKVVIVDDEASGRNVVRHNLKRFDKDLSVIAEADSVKSGIEVIEALKPDIVFLDVQMQDGTGFDLLLNVRERGFKVIFVTSFDNFAIKAIKYNAADYLLKPIEPDLFQEAVERVFEILENRQPAVSVEQFNNNYNKFDRIGLPMSDCVRFISVESILYCSADGNYTRFFFVDGSNCLVCRNMKYYEDILPQSLFIRIHRSFIINIHYVEKYIKGEIPSIVMANGFQIEISRRKKDELLELLDVKL